MIFFLLKHVQRKDFCVPLVLVLPGGSVQLVQPLPMALQGIQCWQQLPAYQQLFRAGSLQFERFFCVRLLFEFRLIQLHLEALRDGRK